jgi:hypothetical protein
MAEVQAAAAAAGQAHRFQALGQAASNTQGIDTARHAEESATPVETSIAADSDTSGASSASSSCVVQAGGGTGQLHIGGGWDQKQRLALAQRAADVLSFLMVTTYMQQPEKMSLTHELTEIMKLLLA